MSYLNVNSPRTMQLQYNASEFIFLKDNLLKVKSGLSNPQEIAICDRILNELQHEIEADKGKDWEQGVRGQLT